jgi:hypothetical protein
MTRYGDIGANITQENIIEHLLRVNILVCIRLAVQSLPQRIAIGKSVLECVRWESSVDVGLAAAATAGMAADSLAEKFLHFENERVEFRQVEAEEGQVCRGQTAC